MKLLRRLTAGCAALIAASVIAIAAGYFPGFPIVGGSAYCTSFLMNPITGAATTTCNGPQVPAGPAFTGTELIPADTGLTQGQTPATVLIPSALVGSHNTRLNRLVGGDFNTNLWQRGTTPISATTATTATMTADRWWAYSSANTMTITKQTGTTDSIPAIGLYASMRVNRPSGTDVTEICVGQTLDKQAAAPLIANNAIFSFYALAGSTFSPTGGLLTVKVAYFTAADAAAGQTAIKLAGTNSRTFALGTTTGYTNAVAGNSPGFATATITSGVATIPITTTWTRYSVYASIPATNTAGTAVTAVGVSLCMTPAASTGASTDWFEFTGAQLQSMSSVATSVLTVGITSPTAFERRHATDEAQYQLYYSYVVNESTTALNVQGSCANSTTSIANCLIAFPTPMRLAPVAVYTAGFEACATTACTSATVCTALTTSATQAWAVSNKQVVVDCASSAGFGAAGTASFLYDIGTGSATGVMSFSAEP